MTYEPQSGLEYYFAIIGAKLDELIYSARLFFHQNILRHNVRLMRHCNEDTCTFYIVICYSCKHKILGWEAIE